jgi:hypothetical protein
VDELDKGIDFALEQLCGFLGVDQAAVCWDAATETLDGDVRSVIGNILRARFGDDWSPASPDAAQQRIAALEEALQAVKAAILSDVNSLAIQCTIFMPGGGAPPHETVVDFIDAALGGGHE